MPTDADQPCSRWDGAPIVNISHDNPDTPLTETQEKIKHYLERVDGRVGIEERLAEVATCDMPRAQMTVDLVSHTTSDDLVLIFDSWEIRLTGAQAEPLVAFCATIKPHVAGFRSLRLIGCGSASTDTAVEALAAMATHLQLPVQGTTTNVYIDHFEPTGFKGKFLHTVMPAPAPPPPPKSLVLRLPDRRRLRGSLWAWWEGFINRRLLQIEGLGEAVDLRHAWELPGLLVEPLLVGRLPYDATLSLTCEVLFRWKWLRIWTPNGRRGIIHPIRDEERLRGVFERIGLDLRRRRDVVR